MTQSKDNSVLKLDDIIDTEGTISINLDDYNMGTTTTWWAGDSITDITLDTSTYDGTFTVDANTLNTFDSNIKNAVDIDWIYNNMNIDPSEVERMCKEYPALEKVWRNFKSVYDMVKKDYEGKKKAGEIDDDIPF